MKSDTTPEQRDDASTSAQPPKQTALYSLHKELGAKMVDFAGWHLPVQYPTGIMAEHHQCRNAAALFDVSHMGQLIIAGDDAAKHLEAILPADLINTPDGKSRYSCLIHPEGGVIDDLIVTRSDDYWYLVVNASRQHVDIRHLQNYLPDGYITAMQDQALLAVQGPESEEIVSRFFPQAKSLLFMESLVCTQEGSLCRISRLGYTGEDGFEISLPNDIALAFSQQLLEHPSCAPAGLGARDSLRLEAGLCLYGQDLDLNRSPVEAGLAWAIAKRRREQGGFLGEDTILRQLADPPELLLTGIKPDGRVPARHGVEIYSTDDQCIGRVTSGGFSPTLEQPIAIGYIKRNWASPNTTVLLEVRKKRHSAQVCALPFVPHRYKRNT